VTLFAVLCLLVVLACREERVGVRLYIAIVGLICAGLYIVWLEEHLLGRIAFFISDEAYYYDTAASPSFRWGALSQHGYLWLAVNRWMMEVDFPIGRHGLKILSIPMLLLSILLLYRIFDRDPRVLVIPLILPYWMWMSIFNMRDVAILTAAFAVIYGLFVKQPSNVMVTAVASIALVLLRPEFFVVLALACALVTVKRLRLGSGRQVWQVVAASAIIVIAVGPMLQARILRVIAWAEYTKFVDYGRFASVRLGEYQTSSQLVDLVVSIFRYVVTPLPHSLFGRLLAGGSTEWGMVDDVVRLGHQLVYFALGMFVLSRIGRLRWLFRSITPAQKATLLFLLAYAPVYGIHLFGVSHQRLKVPFQIAIALIAFGVASHGKSVGMGNRTLAASVPDPVGVSDELT